MEINVGRAYFSLGTHVVLLYMCSNIQITSGHPHITSLISGSYSQWTQEDVFKTSFVRYGCQKDVSYTSCVHRDGLERMAFFFLIYWFMANKSHNQLNWKVNFKMHAMSLFFIRRLWWRSITYYILGIFLHYYLYSI